VIAFLGWGGGGCKRIAEESLLGWGGGVVKG
jgi:hypothetical protein